jgi:hypothetical protein
LLLQSAQLSTHQLQQLFLTHSGQQLVTVSKCNANMYAKHGTCFHITAGEPGNTQLTLPVQVQQHCKACICVGVCCSVLCCMPCCLCWCDRQHYSITCICCVASVATAQRLPPSSCHGVTYDVPYEPLLFRGLGARGGGEAVAANASGRLCSKSELCACYSNALILRTHSSAHGLLACAFPAAACAAAGLQGLMPKHIPL